MDLNKDLTLVLRQNIIARTMKKHRRKNLLDIFFLLSFWAENINFARFASGFEICLAKS